MQKRIWLSNYYQEHTIRVMAYNQNGDGAGTETTATPDDPGRNGLGLSPAAPCPALLRGFLDSADIQRKARWVPPLPRELHSPYTSTV